VCSLCHVLYAGWQADPGVHSLFVYGESGDWEVWICEGAHGYSDVLLVVAFDCVVDRCAALGAKTEGNPASFVPDSDVLARLAANRD
jgi:hypothetical protein